MINKNLLKSFMVKSGHTNDSLADAIGISRTSFSYKINDKRPFISTEISKIAHELKLKPEEIMMIFFADDVDEK